MIDEGFEGGASDPRAARLGALTFADVTFDQAVATTIGLAAQGRRSTVDSRLREGVPVRLSNAYCVSLATRDRDYAAICNGAGITFPDGAPVAWCMRRLGHSDAQRVRGPSLFEAVLDRGRAVSLRHYFVGATETTLTALTEKVSRRYAGLVVAGRYAPDFGPLTDGFYSEVVDRVRAARADVVWVGMGTPKQDVAAAELARRTGLVVLGVGAAFDFTAQTVREAPRWVQRSGFEWLYRLAMEPRRLWRRYLIGNSEFVVIAATTIARHRAQWMRGALSR